MERRQGLQATDGLYWHQGKLIAVQNGFAPQRVLGFMLEAGRARVSAQQIIESDRAGASSRMTARCGTEPG